MNRKKASMTALVGACASVVLLYSGAWAWQININGTATNSFDQARAVAVDGGGNVVAAGFTQNVGTGHDFTVVKFDGVSGVELWRQEINGTRTNSNDQALAVAVDAGGDVVAAGFTQNVVTGNDFTVVKFDGVSGAELWRRVINGTALNSNDQALAVTVDSAGNVVAVGSSENISCGEVCSVSSDFTVIKFDGVSGAELWRQEINGTANGHDFALAVTVDAAGDVVAAGFTQNTGTGNDFTVVKFDGVSGVELWRQEINGTANGDDQALAVAVDASGNVVAAGSTQNHRFTTDFTVFKFDGTSGAELWRQENTGTRSFGNNQANAVTVDAAGNVVAAGVTNEINSNCDDFGCVTSFTVVKLDGVSGAVLWRRVINSIFGFPRFNEALAVAVDGAGNVVAAGFTQECSESSDCTQNFTVVKLDGVSGAELWRRVISSATFRNDQANAVTVDAAGNVVAAGVTVNVGTSGDFTVIKLRGEDGGDF